VHSSPGVAPSTLMHLGFAVESRDDVDAAANTARDEDILMIPPHDAGPVVGYFCIVRDPDGNQVEFSYGQPIDPRHIATA
jgi:catechol 2,3-dioxygenase-like lactoylglutathione lyase family enzyme